MALRHSTPTKQGSPTNVVKLKLVRAKRDQELSADGKAVIESLERLLGAARRGHITGMAAAVVLEGRGYITETVGVARNCPTFARGMVRAIDDSLATRIHSG